MSALSKIFAALSMACYLATSMMAAAHALPMMTASISGSMNIALNATDSDSVDTRNEQQTLAAGSHAASNLEPLADAMQSCHQTASKSSKADTCKIVCSAIAHALLASEQVGSAADFHTTSPHSNIASLTTRQSTVEHQPPK
ncbi:hypothetical protein [Arenicella xantha]|uniref:Killing trait domain-containing protein n=1 Tax=Arenicella xantha TaxID=644221 RepID=A0A395JIN3_9GAMM|nr:hypothetical protein [Arenicella xantha]RBP50633.1 hypothetical protein DFR28_10244 [Arenicella xantha]